ncbi:MULTISPECIES: ribonuclease P protein component [Micrococcales]|uniref:ribonuclease P protein component n=1 Tax=Micrococcales TaxID=85006 RepID=UPI0004AAAE7F|nr:MULTISPECIES: ribonuclease P protein component [Micrococcales]
MLAQQHRMRTSRQFSATTRSGVRSGRRNLVLYARLLSEESSPSVCGFVVSKAVGNAVTRNLVKRRLRELVAPVIAARPQGLSIVVRALPSAAHTSWADLARDYEAAWESVARKLGVADEAEATAEGTS